MKRRPEKRKPAKSEPAKIFQNHQALLVCLDQQHARVAIIRSLHLRVIGCHDLRHVLAITHSPHRVIEHRARLPDPVDQLELVRVDQVDRVDRVDQVDLDRVAGLPDLAVCVQVLRPDLVRNLRPPIAVALALVADLAEVVAAVVALVGTQDLGLVVAAGLAASLTCFGAASAPSPASPTFSCAPATSDPCVCSPTARFPAHAICHWRVAPCSN